MSDGESIKIVDAFDLDDELRSLLKPGEMVRDAENRRHRLPRYFYEVPSREAAMDIRMTPHFGLNEFVLVDLREAPRLQEFPRYVPCAVRVLAFYLEQFRAAARPYSTLSVIVKRRSRFRRSSKAKRGRLSCGTSIRSSLISRGTTVM